VEAAEGRRRGTERERKIAEGGREWNAPSRSKMKEAHRGVESKRY